ncbi:MAG TPA: DUF4175 family protein [Anaeromyxobacteraceae bacterium]|nr:DUF4175 family protein [Anaeromyxobacteraceae bacterium]
MAAAYADIARLLDQAKRRRGRIILVAAAGAGLAIGLALILAGSVALVLGARAGVARFTALGVAAVGLAAAIAWAAWAWRRGAFTAEGVARAVAAGQPALRSDLVSAVELSRERETLARTGAASVELVDAHVAMTAEAVKGLDLAAAIPDRPARRAGWVLAGVLGAHLVAFVAGGGPLARAYGRVLAGDPVAAAAPSLDPITGDIELTYRFPAYTKREPQTISGTGGEIRAPKGTEVSVKTRADRKVEAAELIVDAPAAPAPAPPPAPPAGVAERKAPAAPASQRVALAVANGRDLTGALVVGDGGSYRFRYATRGGKTVAEGPPIPIVVEPDAFPTVRITAPQAELEVAPEATVRVDWQAEDDYGLDSLELVTRTPGGGEQRRPLRALPGLRHDAGSFELPLAAEKLGEGEKLLYWLEVKDNDAISGPKKGSSATQAVKRYSAAEHRRAAMEKARAAWEELIALLGDRLEAEGAGPLSTPARLPQGAALDAKARAVHGRLRDAANEVREEKAAPREVAQALLNVSTGLRTAEQRTTAGRQALLRVLQTGQPVERGASAQLDVFDRLLDEEAEKGIVYLEQLFDKARAEELVRLAKDLADKRRDLQQLLEKYRDAPSEKAKQEVLAQLRRVRQRMQELMARMAETAKGFHDEHMNAEALAELGKQKDMLGGLDAAEQALQKGDVAAAMKALDELGGQVDALMAGLERTSKVPDEKQKELLKEMLAFKEELEKVQAEQQQVAGETERVKAELRRRVADKLEQARRESRRLEQLAKEARAALREAQPGVPTRAELDLETAQDALSDLERALAMKDLDASVEMAQRALAPSQRLAMMLEEDAAISKRFPGATNKDPLTLEGAQKHARDAARKIAQLEAELQKLVPDPRQALTPGDAARLSELTSKQGQLERKAGELQSKLGGLMQKAPVFPPSAPQLLGEARGHMGQATGELSQKNPQRGHGEQQAALDSLRRFEQGLEQMAKRGGGSGGGGFPFPFGEQGSGGQDGESGEPTPEKVEIPGAEAHRIPEEFRKDLMEAMKQGAPERYRGEVQHYYEELVR